MSQSWLTAVSRGGSRIDGRGELISTPRAKFYVPHPLLPSFPNTWLIAMNYQFCEIVCYIERYLWYQSATMGQIFSVLAVSANDSGYTIKYSNYTRCTHVYQLSVQRRSVSNL